MACSDLSKLNLAFES